MHGNENAIDALAHIAALFVFMVILPWLLAVIRFSWCHALPDMVRNVCSP